MPSTWSACEVGQEQQRNRPHPEPRRHPSTGDRVRPGIDHQRRVAAGMHDQRVALTDVAGDQQPAGRRPAGQHRTGPAPAPRRHRHRGERAPAGRRTAPPATATSTPSSIAAPATPPGQAARASGRRAAPVPPRPASAPAAGQPGQPLRRCTGRPATTTAARTPSTVAGATAGSASRLAGIDTRLTAAADRRDHRRGQPRERQRVRRAPRPRRRRHPPGRSAAAQRGASRIRPPVASTDSANPGSRPAGGDTNDEHQHGRCRAPAAPPAAGRSASATSAIAPITAARSTLGDGRASTTNPASATPATTAETRGPAVSARERQQDRARDDRDVRAADGGQMRQPGGREVVGQCRDRGR